MTRHNQDDALLTLREATPLAEAEIERARRYDRAMSVIIVKGGDISRFSARIPDLLVRMDRQRVMVIAPETDSQRAQVFAGRLCSITGARCEGTASFPNDGQSLAALMRAALPPEPAQMIGSVAR